MKFFSQKAFFMILFVLASFSFACAIAAGEPRTTVSVESGIYNPNLPDAATTKRVRELIKEDPSLAVEMWGGINLPGGKASIVMAIAGKTAPDIMQSHFHVIRNDIKQGLLYPLNEWIGDDLNKDGQIDESEVKWSGWKDIPKLWRQVATVDGKVYGIPQASSSYIGVIFRTDLVQAAGLDPEKTPQTWDELVYWCQRLTDPGKKVPGAAYQSGQRGIALLPYGFTWLPWVQSAGGSPIVQIKKSPRTGKEYSFPMEAAECVAPDGEDLSLQPSKWRADFASDAALAATGLYWKLRWMKWVRDPNDGEPINLSADDIKNGFALRDGRKIEFLPSDVISGMARSAMDQRDQGAWSLFSRGEVAMMTWSVNDLKNFASGANVNPDLLSWFPFPAGPGPAGHRVVQKQNHYFTLCEAVGERSKSERDKIWRILSSVTDKSVQDAKIREDILGGLAKFVNPDDLKRLGFDDYLKDVPKTIRQNFGDIDSGRTGVFTEPFMGFWWTCDTAINQEVLSLLESEAGENFDYKAALSRVEQKANNGLMFGRSKAELDKCRPYARAIFALLAAIAIAISFFIVKSFLSSGSKTGSKQVYKGYLPWLLLAPALLLIGVWSYYPLLRGMSMAFQEYRIAGDSAFVGLDNFIGLALDQSWWMSLLRTVYFVFLNMALAFLAPIFLAVLLEEVPRGKILYRTLFFLPQVSSGIVIALMWKLMYDPTPAGFLNQALLLLNKIPFVHVEHLTWLQDPKLAMLCCVIPTVWATMGMSSLIYLAALHSIPPDLYEAADLDGAGLFHKIRYITIPTLLPLIIINFVGAFIGTFQNMGNIFLMTYGGPGETTSVAGLRIWQEAYANLNFSMATSMAWMLGAILIGFTYLQIRILRKVEFKKADWS